MVLAYGDETVAGRIHDHVSESPAGLRCQGFCLATRRPAVEPLVGEVREVDRVVVDGEVAPAVLVNPRARVERLRHHVLHTSVNHPAYDYVATVLAGTALHPVHGTIVGRYLRKPHHSTDDQIRGNGRPPRTVWCDSTIGHDSTPPASTLRLRLRLSARRQASPGTLSARFGPTGPRLSATLRPFRARCQPFQLQPHPSAHNVPLPWEGGLPSLPLWSETTS